MTHPEFHIRYVSVVNKPLPLPLPRNGGGEKAENKDEAVHLHRFILVFGIHPPSQREGGRGMGKIVFLNITCPGKIKSGVNHVISSLSHPVILLSLIDFFISGAII
jgi:hypothetical protein